MAKVSDVDDDVLYEGDWLTARAMRRRNGTMPAKEWFDGLDNRGQGQFLAAMAVLESSFRASRPLAGRADKVQTSKSGIWELRVTRKGGTPPHLRAMFFRVDRTVWVATGFTKTSNKLSKQDIAAGEAVLGEWQEERER